MDKEFLMNLMQMPEEVADTILAQHGKVVDSYEDRLRHMALEGAVQMAITAAGGRNHRAITALLDMDSLLAAEDLPAAAEQAVAQVKKENGYLFLGAPAYAAGTGAAEGLTPQEPMSLAEALKEKFFQR